MCGCNNDVKDCMLCTRVAALAHSWHLRRQTVAAVCSFRSVIGRRYMIQICLAYALHIPCRIVRHMTNDS
eukprot:6703368-Pyramimonas_sp.AAC.1